MPRNLDLTALRSLVAVADFGGVTRAASYVNLTQSAVSMQLKRLEESLGEALLDRSARTIALTSSGEQLVGYARQMLALNDEAFARLTDKAYEGEVVLGVPHDIVYPAIPQVLRRFHLDFPRMKVQLVSSFTRPLKEGFAKGETDLILTTEDESDPGGVCLTRIPLLWIGAPGGIAFRQRPVPLAFEQRCLFRPRVIAALTQHGIPWEMAIDSDQTRSVDALVSADLAVHARLAGTAQVQTEVIDHRGSLPDLGDLGIMLYVRPSETRQAVLHLAQLLNAAFSDRPRLAQAS